MRESLGLVLHVGHTDFLIVSSTKHESKGNEKNAKHDIMEREFHSMDTCGNGVVNL